MDTTEAQPPLTPDAAEGFTGFVRTVARGAHLSRPLTEAEAEDAMERILSGAVAPEQLGAFLMVLRYRKESPEELAGFVRAARHRFAAPVDMPADLDWPSYADRHRQLPYFVLAARLLAENGVRILMHGLPGAGPATTRKALDAAGLAPSDTVDDARRRLDETGFAYLPLESFCPDLQRLFALRPLFGLRSAVNTFARMLNPAAASCQMQGVFHPTYIETHIESERRLGQPRTAVFKGGGGEVQCNPEKACRVATLADGAVGEEVWPALAPSARYPWRDEDLDPARLAALWHGDRQADAPEAAIVGTAAIALKLLSRAPAMADATALARDMWRGRKKA